MKHLVKRVFSLLLALVMIVSLFAGVSISAGAASYSYNAGVRGAVCTSLSNAAQSYWTGDYSFANLNALSGDTLRTTLRTKISTNYNKVGYDGLKTYFPYTDSYQGSSSTLQLFYSGVTTTSSWDNAATWNREHMWPDSLGGNAVEGDLHAMRPTDPKANSTRGNSKYANVRELYPSSYKTATTNTSNGAVTAGYYYSSTYFEPLDSVKGDCARVLLYDYVISSSMSAPTVAIKDIDTLLAWCAMDPVDTYEMQRNDIAQSIQGNRNPFVDYPELAWRLYTSYTIPASMTTPSGSIAPAYAITAASNNTSYGTVALNGSVITATPATGYYAAGYTVTSGAATVEQNGNSFTVTPTSACTVRINFEAVTTVTVTFSVPAGVTQSAMTCDSGGSITLPTPTGEPTDTTHTYRFKGWVTAPCTNVTEQPAVLTGTYSPSGDVTLYALYQYTVGGNGSSDTYTKITAANQITNDASYVFVSTATGKALSTNVTNNWVYPGSNYSGDSITSPTASDVWSVTDRVLSCSGGKLYSSAAKKIALNSSSGTTWTFTASGAGFTMKAGSNTLYYNSTGWRPYSSAQGSDCIFYIYKAGGGGTAYYTTNISACAHSNTTNVAAVEATCLEGGYTAGVQCDNCHEFISGHEATEPKGHAYDAAVPNNDETHSKTCTRNGCGDVLREDCNFGAPTISGSTATYTCTVCGYSKQTQLGNYTVTFNDHGTTATATCVQGSSVTLPATASTIDGYTFIGWIGSAISGETTTQQTPLTSPYTPAGNVTLYACYTRTEESVGGGNYEKVTSNDALTDGQYLIVYHGSQSLAMDASKEGSIGGSNNYISVSISNNTIASTETVDASAFTFDADAGTFATPGGLYIYRNSGTSGGSVSTTSNASTGANSVSISGEGYATITCGTYHLRYNTGGFFRYYTSASQQPVQLYKKGAASITNTFYTTNPDVTVTCEHTGETHIENQVAATCTTAGYTGDTVCDSCGTIIETGTAIPATGHTAGSAYGHNNNQHWLLCSVCGEAVTTTAENHNWSAYVVTTQATEAAAGEETSTCDVCGATRTQAIPALGYDYTVSFSVPEGVTAVAAMSCNSNGSITLPSAGAPADYTFVGWVAEALAEDTSSAPATIYTGSYTASANVTLYALYSYQDTDGDDGSFTLVTASREDWSGEYVLTNENAAYVLKTDVTAPGSASAAAALAGTGMTLSGNTLSGVTDAYVLVVEKISGTENQYSFKLKGCESAYYLNTTDSNSGFGSASSTANNNARWTVTVASSGQATIKNVQYTSRAIRCNTSTHQFRTYSTGQDPVYLYAGASSTTMYTTSPQAACQHPNLSHTEASAATCTSAGNSEYWYCADCGNYYSDAACENRITYTTTVIAALGHSYDAGVVTAAATCTVDGVTTFTCATCGDTYTETITALGHSWDEGVQTTAPTATTAGVKTYTCSRCGATRTEEIPALGVTQQYALATSITSGTEYVMAFHYNYQGADAWYMIGTIGSNACARVEIDPPVNNVLSLDPGEAVLWTVAAVDGVDNGYSLKLNNKYLKGTSGDSALSASNDAVTWIAGSGSETNAFRFNLSGSNRALGLQSGTSIKNYSLSSTGNYIFDIYLFANACEHTNTQLQGAYEATCTTNGYTGDLVCLDCGAVVTPGSTILQGHSYEAVSVTQPTCTAAGNTHYECSRCDSEKDVAIAALGHDYQQTAHLDATCTADGSTTYTCSRCSDSYTDTITATGHHYDAETGVCTNCGDQLASYTVSFTVPAGINAIAPITAFDGATVTLPTPTGTLLANAQDYVFVGWVTADVQDSTDTEYLEPGSYTVTGNVTFKALYTWIDEANSFGTEGVYKLLTENDLDDLDTGWSVIIVNNGYSPTKAMADYSSSGNNFRGANVTVSNNTITVGSSSAIQQFTVEKDDASGCYYLLSNYTDNEDNDYYLAACHNSDNRIALTTDKSDAARWAITYHADGTVKLTAQQYARNTVLFNSTSAGLFSCYGETYYGSETMDSNIYGIRLFASNPIYHFTTAPVQSCEHDNFVWTNNNDGTCTCICSDCHHVLVDHQAHVWSLDPNAAGTVAPTCTAGGKAGYVCDNCRATKLEDTDPLGHDYVGVQTTAPTCSATGVMTYTCSRCGDSYTEPIAAVAHHFENGECTMCGAALYVLVTEAPENWEGEYLIAYVGGSDAKVFDGKNDAAQNYTIGTFYGAEGSESSLICVPNPDDYVVNFVPTDGGYNIMNVDIMNVDAYWWSYTASSNGFSVNTITSFAGTYTIALDASGNAIITNAGGRTLKFNTAAAANGGDRFRFYGTSVYTTIKLYEKYGTCHHDWVLNANASTAATCTAAGNNVYECSVCHETKNETVAALGHDYLYETVAPTCTAEGYTICTCTRCDYEDFPDYSITAALGHDFSALVEDAEHYIAPTCTEEGLAYYKCSRCDAFSEEGTVLEPTGHDYVNGVCTSCGATLTAQTYTLMTSLNFTNAGSVLMAFEYDGAYYVVTEEASGRCLVAQPVTITNNTITVYDDGAYAILIPQTSLNDGTNTGYGFKTVDNDYLHVNNNALAFAAETANAALAITPAQVYSGSYDANDNPIMTNVANAYFVQGKTTGKYLSNLVSSDYDSKLTVNNDSFFAVPIYFFASSYVPEIAPEPSTHNTVYVPGSNATCTEAGYLGYYMCIDQECECAGKMYADIYCTEELLDLTIPALDHNYVWEGTVGDGDHLLECTRCGDVVLEACDTDGANGSCSVCGYLAEAPETLQILSASLILNGKIDVSYTARIPEDYTFQRMVFTGPSGTMTVTAYTRSGDDYVFTYTGVNPQCMGDNISATLYATRDGVEESVTQGEYSVRQYCENMLGLTDDYAISNDLRALLSDMLAYGAAAQTYTGYKTGNLVTSGVTGTSGSTFSALSGYAVGLEDSGEPANVRWTSASLTLTDSVAMRFRFRADTPADLTGLTVNVAVNGREQCFETFEAVGNGIYEVSFTGVSAEEFGATVTASFERNGNQIGCELTYSVNAYVQSKQNDAETANLAALVRALYNYGASAAAYKQSNN